MHNTVASQLKQKVQDHRVLIATCTHIGSPALKDRHWEAIDAEAGMLQCVAVCCSVWLCVAVCCSVLQDRN